MAFLSDLDAFEGCLWIGGWGEREFGSWLHESACCAELSSRAGGAGSLCSACCCLDGSQGVSEHFSAPPGPPCLQIWGLGPETGSWAPLCAVQPHGPAAQRGGFEMSGSRPVVPKQRVRRQLMRLSAALRGALLASPACCCCLGFAWALAAAACKLCRPCLLEVAAVGRLRWGLYAACG